MADLELKVPAISDKYWNDDAVPFIQKKFDKIEANYGATIDKISSLTGLDRKIIKSFIFIESGGDNVTQGLYANGLMEVGLAGASDSIVIEKASGRLSDGEAEIVKKTLGTRWSLLDNLKPNQRTIGSSYVTSADLMNPDFNILVGSIIIKQYIDEFANEGFPRLDKVAVLYNTGRYSLAGKTAIAHKGTTQELIAKIPKGQANYIRKLIGVNSTLDILTV
jgi:hypothetical protein